MAYKHTIFEPLDNSGAEKCLCVQVYKQRNMLLPGENFRGVVKKIRPKDAHNPKVKKGEKLDLITLRTNKRFYKKGINFQFFDNVGLIINKKNVKNRIRGILPLNSVTKLPFKVDKKKINF